MTTKCPCQQCGGHLEFDAVLSGSMINCPHCAQPTTLFVPVARISALPPEAPRETKPWYKRLLISAARGTLITIGLALGIILSIVALCLFLIWFPTAGPTLLFCAIGLCLYFAPSIAGRKKRNHQAIFVLNLLAGWTLVGWIVAAVWASTKDPQEA